MVPRDVGMATLRGSAPTHHPPTHEVGLASNTVSQTKGVLFIHTLQFFTLETHVTHTPTAYGLGRASPQAYLPHHLARLSAAVVTHDAQSIRHAAREADRRLTTAPARHLA